MSQSRLFRILLSPFRKDKKTEQQQEKKESFLETMEAFVVAFILAFIFRAYVVEAFVIPTGSMAPRLLGEHAEFECPNCSYYYDVNLPSSDPTCPLCHTRVHNPEAMTEGRFFGDRILVVKYMYDLFPPQRWDVIVFKYPNDPRQNYIKRLVGLPGEKVELVNGNLHINDEIVAKNNRAQRALWMPVHDTAYWDRRNEPRWQPADGQEPLWEFEKSPITLPAAGEGRAVLNYHHVGQDHRPGPVLDVYAYNDSRASRQNVVTDLNLRTRVRLEQAGILELIIRTDRDEFNFTLPAEGRGEQARILRNGQVIFSGRSDVLPISRNLAVEVAVVDQRLICTVDGDSVFPDVGLDGPDFEITNPRAEVDYTSQQLLVPASIAVDGSAATFERIELYRDIYYTYFGRVRSDPQSPSKSYPTNNPGWGTQGNPYTLQADEFMVFGDNSPHSSDSRAWDESPVVPRENLVGKAFFVYWPAMGARYGIPVRIVPKVDDFRLIR